MIDLYTWITPNGLKISILLEELGLPYTPHAIDITQGEQFAPDFLKISPNNKIPAIVDHETGQTLMESGAIMIYLAEKAGKLLPPDGPARYQVFEWLMWQVGGLGPSLGHAHNFLTYNPGKAPYAEELFGTETQRLYRVLNDHLDGRDYIATQYSIADIAIWPWISRFERHKIDLHAYPHVKRWYLELVGRDAIRRGYRVPHFTGEVPLP